MTALFILLGELGTNTGMRWKFAKLLSLRSLRLLQRLSGKRELQVPLASFRSQSSTQALP